MIARCLKCGRDVTDAGQILMTETNTFKVWEDDGMVMAENESLKVDFKHNTGCDGDLQVLVDIDVY